MNAYVITIFGHDLSEQAAARCIESGKRFGLQIGRWKATTPADDPRKTFEARGWPLPRWELNQHARPEPCMATFLSHHSLWKHCADLCAPIVILEHDAVVVAPIPDLPGMTGACNLGKPSFGRFEIPSEGLGPLTSKDYFPGAHGYLVHPRGAERLLAKAHTARPTDVWLHIQRFKWLQEFYPWPIEAHDWFTTIQKPIGCKAKHNAVEIV